MASNGADLDLLQQRGTEKVLTVLVPRRARRIDDDVVGSLRRGAGPLDHLRVVLQEVSAAYSSSAGLANVGFQFVVLEVEPGARPERIGVAVYVCPPEGKRAPRETLNQIGNALAAGVRRIRRHVFELPQVRDMFAPGPGDENEDIDWLVEPEAINRATVGLVRAGRRAPMYLCAGKGKEEQIDICDVRASPPRVTGTVLIDAIVDGHLWSRSQAILLGTEVEAARRASLAGVQRTFIAQVGDDDLMRLVLEHSGARSRSVWKLEVIESVVDGGRRQVDYKLLGQA
jgi:hypothetical protein